MSENIKRKKDSDEPANGRQFGTTQKAEPLTRVAVSLDLTSGWRDGRRPSRWSR